MKEAVLSVASREGVGKNYARKLRREGRVPAALYGPEINPQSISVSIRDLEKILREHRGENVMISLDIDGKGAGNNKALIRSIQRDPVKGNILHVDFHQISMTRPIHLSIPIRLSGTPAGVKNDGGIMQQIMRELEISCLPTNIPDALELDVSELGIHESIHVSSVTVENATVLSEPERTIVTIVPPTVSKTAVEGEAAEAAEGEEGAEAAPEGAAGEEEKKEEGAGA